MHSYELSTHVSRVRTLHKSALSQTRFSCVSEATVVHIDTEHQLQSRRATAPDRIKRPVGPKCHGFYPSQTLLRLHILGAQHRCPDHADPSWKASSGATRFRKPGCNNGMHAAQNTSFRKALHQI